MNFQLLTLPFLEHGFIDSSCSRPDSVIGVRNPHEFQLYQESCLQNSYSLCTENQIVIRGGTTIERTNSSLSLRRSSSKPSLTSPKSPLPGYVDGDKFVSIDNNGNQHYVKMKKASDDAKTPVISKKSH